MATTTIGGDQRDKWLSNGLGVVVDFAVASHLRAIALLLLVALAAFGPGVRTIPPVDRDESRFAQAVKQAIESGDHTDASRSKPVGIYWLQAGAVKSAELVGLRNARARIGVYRIPSLLSAIAGVLLTYWVALAFVSRRAALLAGLMMATSLLLSLEARLVKADGVLLAAVLAAMGALARIYLGDRLIRPGAAGWLLPAVFWTALAAGILFKGWPVALFVGMTVLTLVIADRSWRWLLVLRPVAGVVWLAALLTPWLIGSFGQPVEAFGAASDGRGWLKLVAWQDGHLAPPGFYFLLFWAAFWPGATLAGLAAPAIWASRREKGARFLLAWLVPAWVLFELLVTKLPHHVLPLYPAAAILIAGVVDSHRLVRRGMILHGTVWWFVLPVLICIALIVGLVTVGRQLGILAWPFAFASIVFGMLAWWLFDADGAVRSLLRAMLASVLISVAAFGVVAPALSGFYPSTALSRILRNANCENPVAASAGYHEPSLVFLAGPATVLTDGAGAADFLNAGGCRFAFVEARHERNFLRRADAIGLRYGPGPRIEGINMGGGWPVSIAVYRADLRR